jgi:hypothetical protein
MIKGESVETGGWWHGLQIADAEDGHIIKFSQSDGLFWIALQDEDGIWRNHGSLSENQTETLRRFLNKVLEDWEDEQ